MPENSLKFHSYGGKRRILVVEDEEINREMLNFLLQDTYDVVFAETGGKAQTILEEQYETLSLVLLDLNLPDMKGTDILRRIKADTRTARIPVIVMTADQDAEVECLNMGATDFIPKPYPKQAVVLARILRTIELFEDRDIIRFTERDQLTGLYNREYFYRYAAQFDTYHSDIATDAIVVNINHFRMLNERYGREFGDAVLKKVAEKLRDSVHEADGIVCRREADTFLIYCPHRSDYDRILEKACIDMEGEYHVRVRMGVYAEVDRSVDMERRFDRAKQAADTVRNSFSHAVGMYDDSMREKELFAEQLLDDFYTAIREKQFKIHYQPKFDIRPAEPILNSAEALVRWQHPKLGMISPGVFIPLFEDNGLIRELDCYVWQGAAAQIRRWKETLGRVIPVSVNVSRIDLYDPKLLDTLEGIAENENLMGGELLLEITESAYTEDSEQIIRVVSALRERGFFVEMDDFGTGYSSLNMITTLPIDALKLDMQMIRTAFKDGKDTRLLEAVIGLAQSLGLPTIAEGVETAEQMFTLKAMGCDIVQGYYFSKPLPAEEFESYVRNMDVVQADPVQTGKPAKTGPKDRYTYDAMHDALTGLYNHSAFDILFHDSDHDHIAVLVVALDGYSDFSKQKGKACADQAVKRVAEVLRGTFRSSDYVCRIQEEKFVVIISRMTSAMRMQVFEKLEQINETLKNAPEGLPSLSLSVGIAFSDRENPEGDVFEDADTALQKAKQQGPAGCVVY
ncbi:MAG: EAL domain-containing protein [Eubacterium sp.]|nr:EAL domain-containing protein [Eubacterium sp.]